MKKVGADENNDHEYFKDFSMLWSPCFLYFLTSDVLLIKI